MRQEAPVRRLEHFLSRLHLLQGRLDRSGGNTQLVLVFLADGLHGGDCLNLCEQLRIAEVLLPTRQHQLRDVRSVKCAVSSP